MASYSITATETGFSDSITLPGGAVVYQFVATIPDGARVALQTGIDSAFVTMKRGWGGAADTLIMTQPDEFTLGRGGTFRLNVLEIPAGKTVTLLVNAI